MEALSGFVLYPGVAGLDPREAAGRLRPLSRAGDCRLTTFSVDGEELAASVACAVDGPRLLLRCPAGSPHPERIWNEPRVRVEAGAEVIDGSARIVSEAEEPAARALLDRAGGPFRRFLSRRAGAHESDELFVEIRPS